MSARTETLRLYRSFLRLRYHFPNKQARSKLRRWAAAQFGLKQLEYERIMRREGSRQIADNTAAKWRLEAKHDLGTFVLLLNLSPLKWSHCHSV